MKKKEERMARSFRGVVTSYLIIHTRKTKGAHLSSQKCLLKLLKDVTLAWTVAYANTSHSIPLDELSWVEHRISLHHRAICNELVQRCFLSNLWSFSYFILHKISRTWVGFKIWNDNSFSKW